MNTHSIIFKNISRILAIIVCVFVVLGYFSLQAAGNSVMSLVRELLEKELNSQVEFINSRYTSLDNMGMSQDEETVNKFKQQILEKLKGFKYKNTACLYIVDDKGMVLMRSKDSLLGDVSKEEFYKVMKSQGQGKVSYRSQGIDYTAVFASFDKWKWTIVVEMVDKEIYAPVHALAWTFISICLSALVMISFIFCLGTFFGITKPVNKIVQEILNKAQSTADTASQVSAFAQQLTQGSIQQAAFLEEASNSLNEITSVTHLNADNADKADQLASKAKDEAQKGSGAMKEIKTAMAGINDSSQKMSKIIKRIEEISFQTNLLALNAAVEAARAGEHGKSFAVVAKEVRNLAQRTSAAAKDTAVLIESSVSSARNGDQIVLRSNDVFSEIIGSSNIVSDIINNITLASKEQAEGIGQVSSTVSQIEQVTQQTAASAKQSSAASEELSSQADGLKQIALKLQQLVTGEKIERANVQ